MSNNTIIAANSVRRIKLEKELIRRRVEVCDPNTATILITGSTFMTLRVSPDAGGLGGVAEHT